MSALGIASTVVLLPAFAVIAILIGPNIVPWMLARAGRDRAGKEVWT